MFQNGRILCMYSGIEIFSVRKIPNVEELPAVMRFFVPNFFQTQLQDVERAISYLKQKGKTPVPYIPVRKYGSMDELEELLSVFKKYKLSDVVILGGGVTDERMPANAPYTSSLQLIKSGLLEQYGIRKIGIAGHPESHPIMDQQKLTEVLVEKVCCARERNLECYVITQLVLDPKNFIRWKRQIKKHGVDVPIYFGVLSDTTTEEYFHFAERCELGNEKQIQKLNTVGHTRVMHGQNTLRYISEELAGKCDGFHIYSYGRDSASLQKSLKSIELL